MAFTLVKKFVKLPFSFHIRPLFGWHYLQNGMRYYCCCSLFWKWMNWCVMRVYLWQLWQIQIFSTLEHFNDALTFIGSCINWYAFIHDLCDLSICFTLNLTLIHPIYGGMRILHRCSAECDMMLSKTVVNQMSNVSLSHWRSNFHIWQYDTA